MALNFEYVKNINTKSQPFISYDTKSKLYNHSLDSYSAIDSTSGTMGGIYSNVNFSGNYHDITTKNVTRIGGKNVPSVGTVAFYKDAVTGNCVIVHVINYATPMLNTVEIANQKLHVVIDIPLEAHYTCYRIVVQGEKFASEYIMYGANEYLELPPVKGDYEVFCFGYDEINGLISGISNTISINVPVGKDDWTPERAEMEERITALENALLGVGNLLDDLNGEVI